MPPAAAPATPEAPAPQAAASEAPPISVDGFADGIKHYQNANDRRDYARHDPRDARAIAENILLYQRQNGGFAPNWDPLRVRVEDAPAKSRPGGGER